MAPEGRLEAETPAGAGANRKTPKNTFNLPPDDGTVNTERAVLGRLLLDPGKRLDGLTPEMFESSKHGLVFEAIRAVADMGDVPDLICVTENLRLRKKLSAAGGAAGVAAAGLTL